VAAWESWLGGDFSSRRGKGKEKRVSQNTLRKGMVLPGRVVTPSPDRGEKGGGKGRIFSLGKTWGGEGASNYGWEKGKGPPILSQQKKRKGAWEASSARLIKKKKRGS